MEKKGDLVFQPKKLLIPEKWKVVKNDFIDLEPDNSYPIDQVFYHFDEDILNLTFKDWCIDLGFYGGYLENDRYGFFKIVVVKGDFNDGEFFEIFISRSTDIIRDQVIFYLNNIPNGLLDNLIGIKYDDNYDFNTLHIFSAINKIDYRLSDVEIEKLAKAKVE